MSSSIYVIKLDPVKQTSSLLPFFRVTIVIALTEMNSHYDTKINYDTVYEILKSSFKLKAQEITHELLKFLCCLH